MWPAGSIIYPSTRCKDSKRLSSSYALYMAQEWNKKAFWRKLSDRVQQQWLCPAGDHQPRVKRTAGLPALAACGVMHALPGYAESAESLHARPIPSPEGGLINCLS